ncbi:MAG: hypothetical protein KKD07_00400, partial [Candidatus Omnitrophica bacterium]|nr:hypothetical protein [Candidatus Omnitrophota bacterium]
EHHNLSKENKQYTLEYNIPEKQETINGLSDIRIRPSAIILFCLIVSVIILATNTVLYYLKTRASSTAKTPISESSITQNPTVSNIMTTESAPINKSQQIETSIVLSGALMAEDKRVALINNDVYEIGESIDEKIITNISLNEVELLDKNGVRTIIKVKK